MIKNIFAIFIVVCVMGGTSMALAQEKTQKATFAGGCFWCIESVYEKVPGVISATSGYTGGQKKNPTYEEVCSSTTGHAEAVEIVYDPAKVSYSQLLDIFWKNIDPTTLNRQFADAGSQYRTAIFYHNEEQKKVALESKAALGKSGRYQQPIVTEITTASVFYPAEEHHQDYYKKEPVHYKYYRSASGREQYLKNLWGHEADHE